MKRRDVLKLLGLGTAFAGAMPVLASARTKTGTAPLVLSTWYNQSVAANAAAWSILAGGGTALDAVEAGVQVCENDPENCCVGLGANPDREGRVTLDASIMNHRFEIGAVAALERIQSPIHTARRVMENTPHVMLVGEGAQAFALAEGATLQPQGLSKHAEAAYQNWLKSSLYKPKINIEKGGPFNHDTIGMIAMDATGNLSGACTTSGMAFKMRGRVGDSPIIGAGLYVDNAVGAATATGHGEEVIRCCGSFLVVELMRRGYSPQQACKKAVERILEITPHDKAGIQVGFIAISKKGAYGGYALQKGFDFGVSRGSGECIKHEALYLL